MTFVKDLQFLLGQEWDLAKRKFDFEALLVHFLGHAVADFVIDLERSGHEVIAFLPEHALPLFKTLICANRH